VFSYSWYLDAVADKWGGVINENYDTLFPVTYTSKLGVNQFYQAFFTREFEVMGKDFSIINALNSLKNKFKFILFRSSQSIDLQNKHRIYQTLNLKETFADNYSKNAKRLIKKSAKHYTYKVIECKSELIDLIKVNVAHKIKEFTPKNIKKLEKLMTFASQNKKGETIGVFDNDTIVGAGFFFTDKSTITYLKGASEDEAKKNGAMYGLLDFAFHQYQNDYSTFDFGGANIENVAVFYKKLGGTDKTYFEYQINNLPLWFKGLKQLKK